MRLSDNARFAHPRQPGAEICRPPPGAPQNRAADEEGGRRHEKFFANGADSSCRRMLKLIHYVRGRNSYGSEAEEEVIVWRN
jgi:hypothetical protein